MFDVHVEACAYIISRNWIRVLTIFIHLPISQKLLLKSIKIYAPISILFFQMIVEGSVSNVPGTHGQNFSLMFVWNKAYIGLRFIDET